MNTFKRRSLIGSAIGLCTTSAGSILLSQRSALLTRVGEPIRIVGLVVTLAALFALLSSIVAERQPSLRLRLHGAREIWAARRIRKSAVTAARAASVLLMILSGVWLGSSVLQFFVALFNAGLPGVRAILLFAGAIGLYGAGGAVVLFSAGLALWLLADIAERVEKLERSHDAFELPIVEAEAVPPGNAPS
jgi:hypothetical protein